LLIKLAKFEKYHNKSALITSVTLKLFITNLISMGILIVIINANLENLGLEKKYTGDFKDVT